jgi:hypothetical protein
MPAILSTPVGHWLSIPPTKKNFNPQSDVKSPGPRPRGKCAQVGNIQRFMAVARACPGRRASSDAPGTSTPDLPAPAILDCGGKRSATPLSPGREAFDGSLAFGARESVVAAFARLAHSPASTVALHIHQDVNLFTLLDTPSVCVLKKNSHNKQWSYALPQVRLPGR